jgi:hypothetical protein
VSLLLCPRARHLTRDVPANAGFVCNKAALIRDAVKGSCI